MSYINRYKARLEAQGKTPGETYSNSTNIFIAQTFADSPNYQIINLNGAQVGARVMKGKTSFEQKILLRPGVVARRGWYVIANNKQWLIMDIQIANNMPLLDVYLCNNIFTIQTGSSQQNVGTDSVGRPVYNTVPVHTSWHCVVANKLRHSDMTYWNDAVNLPEGKIIIHIPYTDNSALKENVEFVMWDYKFKIISLDRSEVVGTEGVIVVHGQRAV